MNHQSSSKSPSRSYSVPSPGPRRFIGSLRYLQDLILLTGDYGEWQEKPNGVWRYRSEDGGGFNWSSTRGTLWFDGPPEPRDRLQRIIRARLGDEQSSSPI